MVEVEEQEEVVVVGGITMMTIRLRHTRRNPRRKLLGHRRHALDRASSIREDGGRALELDWELERLLVERQDIWPVKELLKHETNNSSSVLEAGLEVAMLVQDLRPGVEVVLLDHLGLLHPAFHLRDRRARVLDLRAADRVREKHRKAIRQLVLQIIAIHGYRPLRFCHAPFPAIPAQIAENRVSHAILHRTCDRRTRCPSDK